MPDMNMIKSLNSALSLSLKDDPNVVIFGEDVGYFGGVFRVTEGLQKEYGPHRVFDSPLAEGGIAAIAMGMASMDFDRLQKFNSQITSSQPMTKLSTKLQNFAIVLVANSQHLLRSEHLLVEASRAATITHNRQRHNSHIHLD